MRMAARMAQRLHVSGTRADRPYMNAVKRWPHIARFLSVAESVSVGYAMLNIGEEKMSPAERAAAYEEWADYFEYRLAQRTGELAGNHVKRHLVDVWTDSMVYLYRRGAAYARGEEPGPSIPQHVRRPDLDANARAILEEIIAGLRPRGTRAANMTTPRANTPTPAANMAT
jgi:hypothetical protein